VLRLLLVLICLMPLRAMAQQVPPHTPEDEAKHSEMRPEGVRDGVTPPRLLKSVSPDYSTEARKKKISAVVMVQLIVGEDGVPQEVHVIQPAGYGLDEQAVAAVEQYRFQPAMKDGKPVRVKLKVEVNFQITKKRDW